MILPRRGIDRVAPVGATFDTLAKHIGIRSTDLHRGHGHLVGIERLVAGL